jgi:hypothetical protein
MDSTTIRDRLNSLRDEIAQIQEQNRQYLATKRHSREGADLHHGRESRLVRILEELATLGEKEEDLIALHSHHGQKAGVDRIGSDAIRECGSGSPGDRDADWRSL